MAEAVRMVRFFVASKYMFSSPTQAREFNIGYRAVRGAASFNQLKPIK